MRRWIGGGRIGVALVALVAGWMLAVSMPAVLIFPYGATFAHTTVLSEQPIGPAMGRVLARADRLVAASAVARPGAHRRIVLTDGGWRWRVLALGSWSAFGLRRPFLDTLVFNRSDIAADRVWNGLAVAGQRTLSGTIAHETTHLNVAAYLGEWRARLLPGWVAEGYPDYVARESSMSDAAAARARAAGENPPALFYHDARLRVAAALAAHRGDVAAVLH